MSLDESNDATDMLVSEHDDTPTSPSWIRSQVVPMKKEEHPFGAVNGTTSLGTEPAKPRKKRRTKAQMQGSALGSSAAIDKASLVVVDGLVVKDSDSVYQIDPSDLSTLVVPTPEPVIYTPPRDLAHERLSVIAVLVAILAMVISVADLVR